MSSKRSKKCCEKFKKGLCTQQNCPFPHVDEAKCRSVGKVATDKSAPIVLRHDVTFQNVLANNGDTRTCRNCDFPFTLSPGEKKWFDKKAFSMPRTCAPCRRYLRGDIPFRCNVQIFAKEKSREGSSRAKKVENQQEEEISNKCSFNQPQLCTQDWVQRLESSEDNVNCSDGESELNKVSRVDIENMTEHEIARRGIKLLNVADEVPESRNKSDFRIIPTKHALEKCKERGIPESRLFIGRNLHDGIIVKFAQVEGVTYAVTAYHDNHCF